MAKKIKSSRKDDHLKLADLAQQGDVPFPYDQLNYEPFLHGLNLKVSPLSFLGKKLKAPLWISSMTGGSAQAGEINERLADVAAQFGLGMGLGSCRVLLEKKVPKAIWRQFDLRSRLGEDRPFYANLGIAQLEKILAEGRIDAVHELVAKLRTDGLIIHVNPLQELLQPEGDRYQDPPLETITRFLEKTPLKVIVKEVGQGIGPQGLDALLRLPLAAIEFGAYGGTNFSQLEILRSPSRSRQKVLSPLGLVGHKADEMVSVVQARVLELKEKAYCREFIISGGVKDFIMGHYLRSKLMQIPTTIQAVIGQAYPFLVMAKRSRKDLEHYVRAQVEGYAIAQHFFTLKG